MEKNYYFVCGMPRAGNTLLGTLMNQNTKVSFGANSVLAEILYQVSLTKTTENFKIFPEENCFTNVLKGIFDSYYKGFVASSIFIRSAWGTPANLFILNSIINEPKFIILYRPVLECLASFIKLEKPQNIEARCDQLMEKDGMIGKNLWSIENILNNKEKNIVIHYNNLTKNPEKEIKRICKFLSIKYKKINTKNFKQFSVNNVFYDDTILNAPFHKLRTDKIKKLNYNINDILPKKVINKYSNLDIL